LTDLATEIETVEDPREQIAAVHRARAALRRREPETLARLSVIEALHRGFEAQRVAMGKRPPGIGESADAVMVARAMYHGVAAPASALDDDIAAWVEDAGVGERPGGAAQGHEKRQVERPREAAHEAPGRRAAAARSHEQYRLPRSHRRQENKAAATWAVAATTNRALASLGAAHTRQPSASTAVAAAASLASVAMEVIERLRACIEGHSPALREGLRAALTERTFPPHPRFKGRAAPALDDRDALCGIHVEYGYGDWVPIILGLSRAAAVKCGGRYPLGLRTTSLVDPDLEDVDPELVASHVEAWITAAWRSVRPAAPELRGYVSIHDTTPSGWVDMDTGEPLRDATGLGWL
jgi:hypothetical protein